MIECFQSVQSRAQNIEKHSPFKSNRLQVFDTVAVQKPYKKTHAIEFF